MCRVVNRELPLAPSAVAEARTFVADALRRWELESLVPDAALLTSELVTNSLLHARTDVTVTVAVADGVAEVGVADRSASPPQARPLGVTGESGRGLHLVEQLAQDWGVVPTSRGKQVWFRLDVGSDWPHRIDCPCDGEELDRVRLETGRYAVPAPGPWDED
jgi:anti-sigma regulatory factor (Ser/Thr protein kinase)